MASPFALIILVRRCGLFIEMPSISLEGYVSHFLDVSSQYLGRALARPFFLHQSHISFA